MGMIEVTCYNKIHGFWDEHPSNPASFDVNIRLPFLPVAMWGFSKSWNLMRICILLEFRWVRASFDDQKTGIVHVLSMKHKSRNWTTQTGGNPENWHWFIFLTNSQFGMQWTFPAWTCDYDETDLARMRPQHGIASHPPSNIPQSDGWGLNKNIWDPFLWGVEYKWEILLEGCRYPTYLHM